jgi:hypothetical protein
MSEVALKASRKLGRWHFLFGNKPVQKERRNRGIKYQYKYHRNNVLKIKFYCQHAPRPTHKKEDRIKTNTNHEEIDRYRSAVI